MADDKGFRSETKEEYNEDAKKYFGNLQSAKRKGLSADQMAAADKHLPTKEEEYKKLDYYTKGYGKASRSGAFAKAGLSAAIFPNGLKFASDFIDKEATVGKYKKPPDPFKTNTPMEQKKEIDVPKPAAIISDRCMDCMQLIDYQVAKPDVMINLGFMMGDLQRIAQTGLKFGDSFLSVQHASCMEKVREFKNERLVLIHGGVILSDADRDLIWKYKGQLQIHDGREINLGEWKMIQRLERINRNTYEYLKQEHIKGDSPVFREGKHAETK